MWVLFPHPSSSLIFSPILAILMLWALFQDSDFKLVTSQKADDFTGRLQEAMLKQKMFDLVSAIVIVETYLRTCRKTISLAETQGSSMP